MQTTLLTVGSCCAVHGLVQQKAVGQPGVQACCCRRGALHVKQLQGCLHSDPNLSGPSPSRVQTARWTSSFVAGFLRPCVVDVRLW